MLLPSVQDIVHKFDVGVGRRYSRIGLALLAVAFLIFMYDWRAFRNMSSLEAMDAAQVARNIAEGKGYTTLFIRPLSMYLVSTRNAQRQLAGNAQAGIDPAQIKGMHPDLANPPVYPTLLAGLMKILPFKYAVSTKPFWSRDGQFARYQPDFLITVVNQILFFVVIWVVFLLARRLFDLRVAWLSALVLLGTELYWRFSVSGLSTMLLVLIFLGLFWSLLRLEQEAREPKLGAYGLPALAALAGMLTGLGGLTRYAFGWLILPVLIFLILFGGRRRLVVTLAALLAFVAVLTPWIARNYSVSGTPFGTAGFAVMENTMLFPEHRLERSLQPEFSRLYPMAFWLKLLINTRQIIASELPRMGGTWISAFFLVGLLVSFRNPATRRLRYFLLACLGLLVVVQALGRTQLSEDAPEINSENLLVLLAPLAMIYGVALFYLLLDQVVMPLIELRYAIIGLFALVSSLPLLMVFLPPRPQSVAYPPYFPPHIQTIAGWMQQDELTMSDIPWAMAWYGHRQCVWLTLRAMPDPKDPTLHEDFFAINDYQKPIHALFLTSVTLDSRFLSQWVLAGEQSWGSFVCQCIITREVPPTFPLRKSQAGWLPHQIVLTDWERWHKSP